jgi:hypothetical protein
MHAQSIRIMEMLGLIDCDMKLSLEIQKVRKQLLKSLLQLILIMDKSGRER